MPENTTTTKNKPQKRTNYLTEGRIKKEKAKLSEMFAGIEDEDRRTLVNSVIDEAAFLKVALLPSFFTSAGQNRIEKRRPDNRNEKRFAEIHKSPPFNGNL